MQSSLSIEVIIQDVDGPVMLCNKPRPSSTPPSGWKLLLFNAFIYRACSLIIMTVVNICGLGVRTTHGIRLTI